MTDFMLFMKLQHLVLSSAAVVAVASPVIVVRPGLTPGERGGVRPAVVVRRRGQLARIQASSSSPELETWVKATGPWPGAYQVVRTRLVSSHSTT